MNTKILLIQFMLLFASCLSNHKQGKTSEIDINSDAHQELDTFFYSTEVLRDIGEANGFDMLRRDRPNRLDIVGVSRNDWNVQIGDSIIPFLTKKIIGIESIELTKIYAIELSADLRGDDTWIILIENHVIKEIKNWP